MPLPPSPAPTPEIDNKELHSAPSDTGDLAVSMSGLSLLDDKTAKTAAKKKKWCEHCAVNHWETTNCPWLAKQEKADPASTAPKSEKGTGVSKGLPGNLPAGAKAKLLDKLDADGATSVAKALHGLPGSFKPMDFGLEISQYLDGKGLSATQSAEAIATILKDLESIGVIKENNDGSYSLAAKKKAPKKKGTEKPTAPELASALGEFTKGEGADGPAYASTLAEEVLSAFGDGDTVEVEEFTSSLLESGFSQQEIEGLKKNLVDNGLMVEKDTDLTILKPGSKLAPGSKVLTPASITEALKDSVIPDALKSGIGKALLKHLAPGQEVSLKSFAFKIKDTYGWPAAAVAQALQACIDQGILATGTTPDTVQLGGSVNAGAADNAGNKASGNPVLEKTDGAAIAKSLGQNASSVLYKALSALGNASNPMSSLDIFSAAALKNPAYAGKKLVNGLDHLVDEGILQKTPDGKYFFGHFDSGAATEPPVSEPHAVDPLQPEPTPEPELPSTDAPTDLTPDAPVPDPAPAAAPAASKDWDGTKQEAIEALTYLSSTLGSGADADIISEEMNDLFDVYSGMVANGISPAQALAESIDYLKVKANTGQDPAFLSAGGSANDGLGALTKILSDNGLYYDIDESKVTAGNVTQAIGDALKTASPPVKTALQELSDTLGAPAGEIMLAGATEFANQMAQGKSFAQAFTEAAKTFAPAFVVSPSTSNALKTLFKDVLVSKGLFTTSPPSAECKNGHSTYKTPVPHNCPTCGVVLENAGNVPNQGASPGDGAAQGQPGAPAQDPGGLPSTDNPVDIQVDPPAAPDTQADPSVVDFNNLTPEQSAVHDVVKEELGISLFSHSDQWTIPDEALKSAVENVLSATGVADLDTFKFALAEGIKKGLSSLQVPAQLIATDVADALAQSLTAKGVLVQGPNGLELDLSKINEDPQPPATDIDESSHWTTTPEGNILENFAQGQGLNFDPQKADQVIGGIKKYLTEEYTFQGLDNLLVSAVEANLDHFTPLLSATGQALDINSTPHAAALVDSIVQHLKKQMVPPPAGFVGDFVGEIMKLGDFTVAEAAVKDIPSLLKIIGTDMADKKAVKDAISTALAVAISDDSGSIDYATLLNDADFDKALDHMVDQLTGGPVVQKPAGNNPLTNPPAQLAQVPPPKQTWDDIGAPLKKEPDSPQDEAALNYQIVDALVTGSSAAGENPFNSIDASMYADIIVEALKKGGNITSLDVVKSVLLEVKAETGADLAPGTANALIDSLISLGYVAPGPQGVVGTCKNGHKTKKSPLPYKCPTCGVLMANGGKVTSPEADAVSTQSAVGGGLPAQSGPLAPSSLASAYELLGINPGGKGITLLKHLNSGGGTGVDLDTALATVPDAPAGTSKITKEQATQLIAKAVQNGLVSPIPNTDPPKYVFGTFGGGKPPRKPDTMVAVDPAEVMAAINGGKLSIPAAAIASYLLSLKGQPGSIPAVALALSQKGIDVTDLGAAITQLANNDLAIVADNHLFIGAEKKTLTPEVAMQLAGYTPGTPEALVTEGLSKGLTLQELGKFVGYNSTTLNSILNHLNAKDILELNGGEYKLAANAPAPPDLSKYTQHQKTTAEIASAMSWNPTGKGVAFFDAIMKAGKAGKTVDEVIAEWAFSGKPKVPTPDLAANMLQNGMSKGLISQVPGTNPPKYVLGYFGNAPKPPKTPINVQVTAPPPPPPEPPAGITFDVSPTPLKFLEGYTGSPPAGVNTVAADALHALGLDPATVSGPEQKAAVALSSASMFGHALAAKGVTRETLQGFVNAGLIECHNPGILWKKDASWEQQSYTLKRIHKGPQPNGAYPASKVTFGLNAQGVVERKIEMDPAIADSVSGLVGKLDPAAQNSVRKFLAFCTTKPTSHLSIINVAAELGMSKNDVTSIITTMNASLPKGLIRQDSHLDFAINNAVLTSYTASASAVMCSHCKVRHRPYTACPFMLPSVNAKPLEQIQQAAPVFKKPGATPTPTPKPEIDPATAQNAVNEAMLTMANYGSPVQAGGKAGKILKSLVQPLTIQEIGALVGDSGVQMHLTNLLNGGAITQVGDKYILTGLKGAASAPPTATTPDEAIQNAVDILAQNGTKLKAGSLGHTILQSLVQPTALSDIKNALIAAGFKSPPTAIMHAMKNAGVIKQNPDGKFVIAGMPSTPPQMPGVGQVGPLTPTGAQGNTAGAEEIKKLYPSDHPIQRMKPHHAEYHHAMLKHLMSATDRQAGNEHILKLPPGNHTQGTYATAAAAALPLTLQQAIFDFADGWCANQGTGYGRALRVTVMELGAFYTTPSVNLGHLDANVKAQSLPHNAKIPEASLIKLGLDPHMEYEFMKGTNGSLSNYDNRDWLVPKDVDAPMLIQVKNTGDTVASLAKKMGVPESAVIDIGFSTLVVKGPSRAEMVLAQNAVQQAAGNRSGTTSLQLFRGINEGYPHKPIAKMASAYHAATDGKGGQALMSGVDSWSMLPLSGFGAGTPKETNPLEHLGGGLTFSKEVPNHYIFAHYEQKMTTPLGSSGTSQGNAHKSVFYKHGAEHEALVIGHDSYVLTEPGSNKVMKLGFLKGAAAEPLQLSAPQADPSIPPGFGKFIRVDEVIAWFVTATGATPYAILESVLEYPKPEVTFEDVYGEWINEPVEALR